MVADFDDDKVLLVGEALTVPAFAELLPNPARRHLINHVRQSFHYRTTEVFQSCILAHAHGQIKLYCSRDYFKSGKPRTDDVLFNLADSPPCPARIYAIVKDPSPGGKIYAFVRWFYGVPRPRHYYHCSFNLYKLAKAHMLTSWGLYDICCIQDHVHMVPVGGATDDRLEIIPGGPGSEPFYHNTFVPRDSITVD